MTSSPPDDLRERIESEVIDPALGWLLSPSWSKETNALIDAIEELVRDEVEKRDEFWRDWWRRVSQEMSRDD